MTSESLPRIPVRAWLALGATLVSVVLLGVWYDLEGPRSPGGGRRFLQSLPFSGAPIADATRLASQHGFQTYRSFTRWAPQREVLVVFYRRRASLLRRIGSELNIPGFHGENFLTYATFTANTSGTLETLEFRPAYHSESP